jgi:predicted DNA-binding transcriptional regulator YafY
MAIMLLLESRGQLNASDLARALSTSERTVYRDIETLCEAGMPIAASTGPGGGFSLEPGYAHEWQRLQAAEVISMFLSGVGFIPDRPDKAATSLMTAASALEDVMSEEYRHDMAIARERFLYDPEPWWQARPNVASMEALRQAVWKSRKLRITYVKGNEDAAERTERAVHPYGLVFKKTDWFLIAYCELRQATRVFACERIEQAELLDECFERPDGFSLKTLWEEQKRAFMAHAPYKEDYAPDQA